MSPLDEIRHINKLAKKHGRAKLGPYHRWVLGGCRGPCPKQHGLKKFLAWEKRERARRRKLFKDDAKARARIRRRPVSKADSPRVGRTGHSGSRIKQLERLVRKLRKQIRELRAAWEGA